ncbi:HIT-like protein [Pseudovirgaria hyperparasitica]|uniref:HIT-like protein n=1 Tax=Pseudovirgaria hyperparasitica TaxID=470096 RepID=A0A6A6WIK5_9PEZI|nr:HIT-like protein [Pseudovirgaria hyperparasitica]KAF2761975.1 HIT-like protein [Pseudovirgaria hyperparasitica]
MSLDDHYPTSCPFCGIASAYPAPPSSASTSTSLAQCIPTEEASSPDELTPAAFVVFSAPEVIAFLDIMPMARGHLLVATRRHVEKVGQLDAASAGEIGRILPLLSTSLIATVSCTDYNIVQNNGAAAAQIVPHIHFHIIPRNASTHVPEMQARSWTMFGRGQRAELDEEDGTVLARQIRERLREEVRRTEQKGKL